jgi:hypothetical protein
MRTISEEKFIKVINEVSKESCSCHNGFCIFRNIIEKQHFDVRTLIQLQCILKFRYEESCRHQCDLGLSAEMKWFESGLAKSFADVYCEELSFDEIYSKTVKNYNPETGKMTYDDDGH